MVSCHKRRESLLWDLTPKGAGPIIKTAKKTPKKPLKQSKPGIFALKWTGGI